MDRARPPQDSAMPPPDAPTVSAVVPLFDERENLPELYRRLTDTLADLGVDYELVFVNDGSSDGTAELLDAISAADDRVRALHLSRNFGHQPALTAGLDHARGDAVIALDGDLQDPPEVIPELLEKWREGFDVVYAVRTKRKEGLAKRLGYFAFYRLLRGVSDLPIPLDAGDFCLLDRRALDALNGLPECDRFVRGLRSFVGFRQVGVTYERDARFAGTAKYTFRKLVGLAVNGLMNFSAFPVRAMGWLAGLLVLGGGVITAAIATGTLTGAWAIVLAIALFLSGLQIGCLSLLGLYLVKILAEVKRRPSYILSSEPVGSSRPRALGSMARRHAEEPVEVSG
jgi:polyisoprenyl-phosphate glycosyltransferase